MPASSRKHPPDKPEFIAPMDAYPLQKSISILQVFEALSEKHFIKILKHFEISSRVLQLYCNIVV